MERKEKIRIRYKKGAKQLSVQSLWNKLECKAIWGFSDTGYTKGLLEKIPDDFSGSLLDVPKDRHFIQSRSLRTGCKAFIVR